MTNAPATPQADLKQQRPQTLREERSKVVSEEL